MRRIVFIGAIASAAWFAGSMTAYTAPTEHQEHCTQLDLERAKELAAHVQALSKTDPAMALQLSEDVARHRPACFQTAFGEFLNGTGTASIGGPGPTGDTGGVGNDTGSNEIPEAPSKG